MKQAKYRFPSFRPASALAGIACLIACLIVFGAASLPLRADVDTSKPTPPIGWVQARVFHNLTLQDFKLQGVLHTGTTIIPLELRTKNKEMVYLFKQNPLQIRVILDPASSTVERRQSSDAPWVAVTGHDLSQRILGTDITYEDLGLNFIFWDHMIGVGTDSIKTLPAWCFEAYPSDPGSSAYAKVRYWISSDYFAFLRVDGYNAQGQIVKRVEVNGVTQIGDAYVIKEMEIATMLPDRDLSASRTYIEVHSGAPGSGL